MIFVDDTKDYVITNADQLASLSGLKTITIVGEIDICGNQGGSPCY